MSGTAAKVGHDFALSVAPSSTCFHTPFVACISSYNCPNCSADIYNINECCLSIHLTNHGPSRVTSQKTYLFKHSGIQLLSREISGGQFVKVHLPLRKKANYVDGVCDRSMSPELCEKIQHKHTAEKLKLACFNVAIS